MDFAQFENVQTEDKRLSGGEQELTLVKVELAKAAWGGEAIKFYLEDNIGKAATLDIGVYEAKGQDAEKDKKGAKRWLTQLAHILQAFNKEYTDYSVFYNKIVVTHKTAKGISEAFVEAMNSSEIKVAEWKITLNKSNFLQIPLFPDFVKSELTPGRKFKKDKMDIYTPAENILNAPAPNDGATEPSF